MFQYLPLITANALRNRRRSALTAASIAVSLCLLSTLAAGYRALSRQTGATPDEALRLVVHHKVSITQPMPVSFEDRIRRIPGVRDAMVAQWFGGTYKDTRDPRNFFARFAVEPTRLFVIHSDISLPLEQQTAFQRQRTACIVGDRLAARFGWKPGDRVVLTGDIFPVTLDLAIAGIFTAPEDNQSLYFHYDFLRELLKSANLGADAVGVFQVLATSTGVVSRVADEIDKEFENSPAPTETETERAWQLSFISFVGNLQLFLVSICAALGFTVLLVSANTVSMAIRERTREVAILKTLGFTPGKIIALTMAESTTIAVAGGAIGVVLAAGLCVLIRHSRSPFAALKLTISLEIALVSLAVAAVLGVISSIVPAWRASRARIVEALRNAG